MFCGCGVFWCGVVGCGSNSVISVCIVIGLFFCGCVVCCWLVLVLWMCFVIVVIVIFGRVNVGVFLLFIGGKIFVFNEVVFVSVLSVVSNVGFMIFLKVN